MKIDEKMKICEDLRKSMKINEISFAGKMEKRKIPGRRNVLATLISDPLVILVILVIRASAPQGALDNPWSSLAMLLCFALEISVWLPAEHMEVGRFEEDRFVWRRRARGSESLPWAPFLYVCVYIYVCARICIYVFFRCTHRSVAPPRALRECSYSYPASNSLFYGI